MIVSNMSKTNCDIHRESNYVKAQEKFWEVEMTAADKAFYNDQKDEYKQFCTRNVDPKWCARQERRKKRRKQSRVESYNADELKGVNFKEELNCSNHEDNVQVDTNYNFEEGLQNSSLPRKKKYEYVLHSVTKQIMGFLGNLAIFATA